MAGMCKRKMVLTVSDSTSNDYTLCVKKQNYINAVAERIRMGDTFAAAVTGAVSIYDFVHP